MEARPDAAQRVPRLAKFLSSTFPINTNANGNKRLDTHVISS
jgi:hypothetical protein